MYNARKIKVKLSYCKSIAKRLIISNYYKNQYYAIIDIDLFSRNTPKKHTFVRHNISLCLLNMIVIKLDEIFKSIKVFSHRYRLAKFCKEV